MSPIPDHVKELNVKLSSIDKFYNINEYILEFSIIENNVNDSFESDFINKLLALNYSGDEFSIHHNTLIDYGIISKHHTSATISDIIWFCSLLENTDYICEKNDTYNYIFTTEAFKKILIVKSWKARKYYLFLEKSIKYYENYQYLKLGKK